MQTIVFKNDPNINLIFLLQKPFIIVTQNEDLVRVYRTKRVEIFVMTMGDYLQQFWPGDKFHDFLTTCTAGSIESEIPIIRLWIRVFYPEFEGLFIESVKETPLLFQS